jgi:outer membrane protein assembly factor BamB
MTMHLAFGERTGTVVHDGRIYLQFDHKGEGFVVALNAADGTELWRAPRMENSSWSTPLDVNERVYLATEEGDVVVVKTGNQFEVLATNTLANQSFIASPIAIGRDLYLRSRTQLFRISEL